MAHYLQYLLINGQLMFPLLGNPTGDASWPLHLPYPFNDSFEPNVHILPTSAAWYVAVAVIVIVHILAVFVAHAHLGSSAKDPEQAKRSEYPWIAAMVAYTMLSLWLLAQPLVKDAPPPPHHATSIELSPPAVIPS
jgi:Na+/proline symporter